MQEWILLFAFVTAILWLVIGWRAMRAHEHIAASAARYLEFATKADEHEFRQQSAEQNRRYKEFLRDDPAAAEVPPKERHELFRAWLEAKGESGD